MCELFDGEQDKHPYRGDCERINASFAAYEGLLSRLRKAVERIVRSAEDVKEVIQETILTAWQKCPPAWWREEKAEKLERWLLVVARRLAINRARHLKRHRLRTLDALLAEPRDRRDEDFSDGQTRARKCALLRTCMEGLRVRGPVNYRLAYGYYYENRSIGELAEAEGLTAHAVTNRLSRVRARFRAQLLKLEDDADAP
ncbi:MAG TPA: RNA polymerase sigma factor [Gemmataceae bacterium]